MNANTIFLLLNVGQLLALLGVAGILIRIGESLGIFKTTVGDHAKRLDRLEPKVERIDLSLSELRGEHAVNHGG